MIEELKEDKLIEKVGGRFRLSSLIRQRLVALNGGSSAYVNVPKDTPHLEVVVREILEDKIFLNMEGALEANVDAKPIDYDNVALDDNPIPVDGAEVNFNPIAED